MPSAAIDAEDLETAVELLEQGRAILWSKMKGYRYPLDPLCQVTRLIDSLLMHLRKLNVQLEQLALSSESGLLDHDRSNLEVWMQGNHTLLAKWEKTIGQMQEIDGFQNFFKLLHSLLFEWLLWRVLLFSLISAITVVMP